MARFLILKGSTSTWSTLRNPQLVYFRTTCFYNPLKYCILLSFHINIIFLNVFQTSPFCPYRVPDIATWSYQTRVFHLLITSWHIFPVQYFTLAPFFAFSLIRLSYINKSFVTRMSYLLPCAKFQRVTFFMKRSYLLPRENFKLPYLPNQAHWDPGICSQLRSSHIHSIHHKSSDFINGNVVYLSLICAVWSSRGRAGKKVTAVTFFRCPTVTLGATARSYRRQDGADAAARFEKFLPARASLRPSISLKFTTEQHDGMVHLAPKRQTRTLSRFCTIISERFAARRL